MTTSARDHRITLGQSPRVPHFHQEIRLLLQGGSRFEAAGMAPSFLSLGPLRKLW